MFHVIAAFSIPFNRPNKRARMIRASVTMINAPMMQPGLFSFVFANFIFWDLAGLSYIGFFDTYHLF